VQTRTASAVAIAASYAAKAFGIKTGTLTREARQLCPAVIPVQANHRLYTEYHERILKAVDTCLPVEKVCSIDEMACRLMGTERQVPVARELPLKVKGALRGQVGECLTCSVGIAPGIARPEEFRTVTRAHVIAWRDDLARRELGGGRPARWEDQNSTPRATWHIKRMVLNEGRRNRDSQSRPAGSSTAMFWSLLSAMLCSRSAFASHAGIDSSGKARVLEKNNQRLLHSS